jgi:hypothetical protein
VLDGNLVNHGPGMFNYLSDFATEDVSEGRECIVHGLVVDGLVQVLDEDIADSGSAKTGIALAPHDADGAALQHVEVHRVQSTFSCIKI